ncbi:MAG: type II toxin-antitoxin system MqsA family antitoxin [Candidatus Dormibacteraeota bacterium]|nr:type II toxin-antitoxin system MqsA family antitoxin [Candidatus Dormibacteraeota bacterium]
MITQCVICKVGRMHPGKAAMTFDDDEGLTMVIRHVPADVCDTCGEAEFDEETARTLLAQAQRQGRGVLVLDYAA